MNNATNIIDDLRLLEPFNPWPWLIAAGVVVVLLIGLLLRRRIARRSAQTGLAIIAAHAHEDAFAELEKARALIQPGNSRAYSIEVSNIIRRYIERRFDIVAPRRSTEEFIIEAAGSVKLESHHRELLREFLGSCDFLKFGRGLADVQELEAMHAAAVKFVSETRVTPAVPMEAAR